MTDPDESEFDLLPEALRLALMDRARLLGDDALAEAPGAPPPDPAPLSMRQIADAASIGRGALHWRYRAALAKLRMRADGL